jgi:hypothetical protein
MSVLSDSATAEFSAGKLNTICGRCIQYDTDSLAARGPRRRDQIIQLITRSNTMSKRTSGRVIVMGLVVVTALCFVPASISLAQHKEDKKAEQLMQAIEEGDMQKAAQLAAHVNPNVKLGGSAPILVAVASTGQAAVVKVLLDKGANVNAHDPDGETALMAAVGSGNIEVVTMLLDKGADVKAKNKDGRTALKMLDQSLKIRELLMQRGAKE